MRERRVATPSDQPLGVSFDDAVEALLSTPPPKESDEIVEGFVPDTKARVMVEGPDEAEIHEIAAGIAALIK